MSNDGTCNDCGTSPVWWFAHNSKCRRCFVKGGERDYIEVDPDKVREELGGRDIVAESFLEKVRYE